jgi:hypothetical protein
MNTKNALLVVALGIFCLTAGDAYAFSWTERMSLGVSSWNAVGVSSDSTVVTVAPCAGSTSTSLDSGATWTPNTSVGSECWTSVALSFDGVRQAAVASGGLIYTSLDSGATWTPHPHVGIHSWRTIASSSDGMKLVAAESGPGNVYTSVDAGWTWLPRYFAGISTWLSVASSSSGARIAAVDGTDSAFISLDSGATWTPRSIAYGEPFEYIASSASGTQLIAAGRSGYIYLSTNGGTTWTRLGAAGARQWSSLASSSDGQVLVAADYGGYLYTSLDGGTTWTPEMDGGTANWSSVALSSSGSKIAAVRYGGSVWIGSPNTAPDVSTRAAGSITSTSATIDGEILATGGAAVSRRFVVGPTTAYGSTISIDTAFSGGVGTYSTTLTGLLCGTTYHYQARATNASLLSGSGSDMTFSTLACSSGSVRVPSVTTVTTVTSITQTSAVINGAIMSTGGENPDTRGFVYGSITTASSGSFRTGGFATTLTGLLCGTRYNFRAYATNSAGTGYGLMQSFSTVPCLASVATNVPTSVSRTGAILGGTLSSLGGALSATVGFQIGRTTAYGTTITLSGARSTPGVFSSTPPSPVLAPNTLNQVRAFAANTTGVTYGPDIVFTTLP